MTEQKRQGFYLKPLFYYTVTLVSIFLIELLVMFLLRLLPVLSPLAVAFLDAFLLTLLVVPFLYLFLLKPIRKNIELRERGKAAHKLTAEELRESEGRFKGLFVKAPLGIALIDSLTGHIYEANPMFAKIAGRTIEEIAQIDWMRITHPDDIQENLDNMALLNAGKINGFQMEKRYIHPDGSVVWINMTIAPENVKDKAHPRHLSMIEDITERKKAEEEFKKSEDRFRLLVENAPDAIFARNKRGCFTYLNKAAIALFGATSAQELIGTPTIERYHPKVRGTLLGRMQIINEQQLAAPLHQTICLQSNGNDVNVETTAVPMHYMGEDGALVFMRDITDRIEQQKQQHSLEKQLHQSQKLESVGTLAGGIAHDFNNVLTGLYGNLALAKMKIANDHPGFRFLEAAEQAMSRTTALTNRLLTFSKGGDPVTESLDLVSLIEEIVNFCLSGSNVIPIITSEGNPWLALVDHKQIQQVFANLTANATEAMPNGGLLTITIENADLADKAEHGLPGVKYLRITVIDEGTGIAPDLLDRIFDPYFTTKQSSSGLGLATAYSIINKHRGHISVASQLDKGTTCTIYLPATELTEETPLQQPSVAHVPLAQGAKILVMDDEEMIRNMLNELLGELGFTVEMAVAGQQAIDMYQQSMDAEKPFATVILDLTIPGGMGGQEAARGILEIDPEAKMIVSSGYADDPVMANYVDYGFKGVVPKPFELGVLIDTVNKVLMSD